MRELDVSDVEKRLKAAGGGDGELRISLVWGSTDDLDLHVETPRGETIYYERSKSSCGGMLDVDMNREREKPRC
ncbi:unnamed protein product [Cladocopium goreaui]|uniref:DUF2135 domain-containing protein n=1 Tax=Cladocopium goreaui TaxID=2562237 RepID=A0A9P1CBE4_9DINO|nr:unnamed protein product [Cladocopium goreaui]